MSDTVTKQCAWCGNDFDFIGVTMLCDICFEEQEEENFEKFIKGN